MPSEFNKLVKCYPEETLRKAQEEADEVQKKLDKLINQYDDKVSKIVKVRIIKGNCDGFIQRRELKSHLKIYVKVFHGKRERHEIEVSINDKI